MVLNHDDLLEMNIHVDQDGHITSIVNWADAKVAPFGTSIGGLGNGSWRLDIITLAFPSSLPLPQSAVLEKILRYH